MLVSLLEGGQARQERPRARKELEPGHSRVIAIFHANGRPRHIVRVTVSYALHQRVGQVRRARRRAARCAAGRPRYRRRQSRWCAQRSPARTPKPSGAVGINWTKRGIEVARRERRARRALGCPYARQSRKGLELHTRKVRIVALAVHRRHAPHGRHVLQRWPRKGNLLPRRGHQEDVIFFTPFFSFFANAAQTHSAPSDDVPLGCMTPIPEPPPTTATFTVVVGSCWKRRDRDVCFFATDPTSTAAQLASRRARACIGDGNT